MVAAVFLSKVLYVKDDYPIKITQYSENVSIIRTFLTSIPLVNDYTLKMMLLLGKKER